MKLQQPLRLLMQEIISLRFNRLTETTQMGLHHTLKIGHVRVYKMINWFIMIYASLQLQQNSLNNINYTTQLFHSYKIQLPLPFIVRRM